MSETIEVVADTHFKNASELNSKREIIEELAIRVFATESLLDKALDYAEKHKQGMDSMEDYCTKFFGFLVGNFEDLRLRNLELIRQKQKKLRRKRSKK